jgi:16S rRNA A1518/A1519 N6-dimethyltransferase RsmA/KsgA/DIM1 with predicted DNA glycosylase/AP lyase activity
VLAIEKDARLVAVLKQRFANAMASNVTSSVTADACATLGGSLELLHADALDFLKQQPRDWAEWKLVANLPLLGGFSHPCGIGTGK